MMYVESLPAKFKRLLGKKVTFEFRDAVEVEEMDMIQPKSGQLLIKNRFVGVNSCDMSLTGGYFDPNLKPPYPIGLEAVGSVVAVGEGCDASHLGQSVIYLSFDGAFSEYTCVTVSACMVCLPVKQIDRNYVPLMISALTASVALEQVWYYRLY